MNVLETVVTTFCQASGIQPPDVSSLNLQWEERGDFMDQLKSLDAWMEKHSYLEPLEPYLFDLFMTHYMSRESFFQDPDYWDSPEWEAITDQVEDRGSEWLNLLVYFFDCAMHAVEPASEDFLNEFLLVDEDDHQDEYEIYEPFILLQGVIGEEPETIMESIRKVDPDELGSLLTVLLLFFSEVESAKGLSPLESALLAGTWVAYREEREIPEDNGIEEMPE